MVLPESDSHERSNYYNVTEYVHLNILISTQDILRALKIVARQYVCMVNKIVGWLMSIYGIIVLFQIPNGMA